MATKTIKNQTQLEARIEALTILKNDKEKIVLQQAGELAAIIKDPAPVIRRTIRELAADKDVRGDVLKLILSMIVKRFEKRETSPDNEGKTKDQAGEQPNQESLKEVLLRWMNNFIAKKFT